MQSILDHPACDICDPLDGQKILDTSYFFRDVSSSEKAGF